MVLQPAMFILFRAERAGYYLWKLHPFFMYKTIICRCCSEFSAITNYPYANSRSKWRQSRKCIIMQINRKSHTVRAHIKKVGVLQRAYRPFSLMKSLCWKRQTLLSVSAVHQTFMSRFVSLHCQSTLFVYFTEKCLCCNIVYPQWLY